MVGWLACHPGDEVAPTVCRWSVWSRSISSRHCLHDGMDATGRWMQQQSGAPERPLVAAATGAAHAALPVSGRARRTSLCRCPSSGWSASASSSGASCAFTWPRGCSSTCWHMHARPPHRTARLWTSIDWQVAPARSHAAHRSCTSNRSWHRADPPANGSQSHMDRSPACSVRTCRRLEICCFKTDSS